MSEWQNNGIMNEQMSEWQNNEWTNMQGSKLTQVHQSVTGYYPGGLTNVCPNQSDRTGKIFLNFIWENPQIWK